jgi:RNA polymerase sigma-70 factor, ECF subfamily
MEQLTDEELISRFRNGNGPAAQDPYLNELFNRYLSRVSLWAWRYTGDREAAADLAQEVLLRVFEKLDTFEGNSQFGTWLYAVVRNHCLNAVKSKAWRMGQRSEPLEVEPAEDGGDVLDRLVRESEMTEMNAILEKHLEETERNVLALHYGQEMTLDAVTGLLGLENASGAKAYIVSAKRKLQRVMERLEAGREKEGRSA